LVQEIEKSHQWCEYLKLPPSVAVLFWIQIGYIQNEAQHQKIKILFPENIPSPRHEARQAAPKAGCFAVLPSTFFVMVFVADTRQHLYFLKIQEKNTRATANATNKNPRQKKMDGS
jgi:hypothetical protein